MGARGAGLSTVSGLKDLVRTVQAFRIRSIAIPPLGCGNGGLDWKRPVSATTPRMRMFAGPNGSGKSTLKS